MQPRTPLGYFLSWLLTVVVILTFAFAISSPQRRAAYTPAFLEKMLGTP